MWALLHEVFLGRMGLGYDQFYDHEIKALYQRKRGYFKQKDEEYKLLRTIVVEQTIATLRSWGDKKVSFRTFGLDIGPKEQLSKEELQAKIEKAKSIKWRVGASKKKK